MLSMFGTDANFCNRTSRRPRRRLSVLMTKSPLHPLAKLLLHTQMVMARTPPLLTKEDPSRTRSSCPRRPMLISPRTSRPRPSRTRLNSLSRNHYLALPPVVFLPHPTRPHTTLSPATLHLQQGETKSAQQTDPDIAFHFSPIKVLQALLGSPLSSEPRF